MLMVYTARVSYGGPDRLDITSGTAYRARQKGELSEGAPFAPTGKLVGWGKRMMREADKRRAQGDPGVDAFEEFVWMQYAQRYRFLMRESYKHEREAWEALLDRERVVLVCFCTRAERCHRRLLATYLEKLGAADRGELDE